MSETSGRRGGAPTPGGGSSTGVCGPDVSAQLVTIWSKIQSDFRSWTPDQKSDACSRILIPIHDGRPDINGWDVLPLYQGESDWLENYPIYEAATGGPCATPSNSPPDEDASKCSHSVQVKGQCWLNGTVNYGTYGIMIRLCHDEFPIKWAAALTIAESLIRLYKGIVNPESPELPIAWVRATYNGGPGATPSNPGNRPQCKCTCPCTGSVTNWDYVWEPVKPRSGAASPKIALKPAPTPPPAPAPVVPVIPGVKSYTVMAGDTLSKIAGKVYGDPSLWPKIYGANKATIGPNPNFIKSGQKLVIP